MFIVHNWSTNRSWLMARYDAEVQDKFARLWHELVNQKKQNSKSATERLNLEPQSHLARANTRCGGIVFLCESERASWVYFLSCLHQDLVKWEWPYSLSKHQTDKHQTRGALPRSRRGKKKEKYAFNLFVVCCSFHQKLLHFIYLLLSNSKFHDAKMHSWHGQVFWVFFTL